MVPNIAQNTTIVPNHVSVTIRLNGFNVGAVHRLNPATTTAWLFSAALEIDIDPALIGNARSAIIIKFEGKFGVRNTAQNRLIELVPANNVVTNDNAWDCGLSQYIAAIRSAVNAGHFFTVEGYIRRLLKARMNAMVVDWGNLLQVFTDHFDVAHVIGRIKASHPNDLNAPRASYIQTIICPTFYELNVVNSMTENDKRVMELNMNNLEKQLNGVFPKSFTFVKCKVVKKVPKWLKYGHKSLHTSSGFIVSKFGASHCPPLRQKNLQRIAAASRRARDHHLAALF